MMRTGPDPDALVRCIDRSRESSPDASPSGSCWCCGWVVTVVASSFAASSRTSRTTRRPRGCPRAPSRPAPSRSWTAFQDPNAIPTVVVYQRELRAHRRPTCRRDRPTRRSSRELDGVEGEVLGPFPSKDGQVAQTVVTFNFGAEGWNEMPDTADALRRHRPVRRRDRLHRRRRRPGRRLRRGVRRASTPHCSSRPSASSSSSCCSPTAARSCGSCRSSAPVVALFVLPGSDLLPGQVRRPHRQRAEPRHPDRSW